MPKNGSFGEAGKDRDELTVLLEKLGKKFAVEFEPLAIGDHKLEVLNITNMPEHLDRLLATKKIEDPLRDLPLWAKVWPASLVLGHFLRKQDPAGKTLLEIGAGMGVCSLIASAYGFKRIVISDASQDALDFARANILKNGLEQLIQTSFVEIGAPGSALEDEKFDLIAASELLYLEDLHRPLLKFLHKRLKDDGRAIFCTDIARLKKGFKKLAEKEFSVQEGHIGVKAEEDGKIRQRVYNLLLLGVK